jgi:3-phytase
MGLSQQLIAAASLLAWGVAGVQVDLPVSALTSEVESDWSSVYYSKTPLLVGNDGSAASGGWLAWKLDSGAPLSKVHAETPGRTKIVTTIHGRDDDDKQTGLVVSIGQPDSILRAWELPDFKEVKSARRLVLGDWSALCSWKSPSGNDYLYLFGKKEAKMFLVRKEDDDEDDYDDAEIEEACHSMPQRDWLPDKANTREFRSKPSPFPLRRRDAPQHLL